MAVNERTRPMHLGNRPAEHMKANPMQTKGLSDWTGHEKLERVMGIEPTSSAWKAEALPLCYTRISIKKMS